MTELEKLNNGETIVQGYGRCKNSKQFNNNKMKKQIKKDNTLFNVIFLLCGAILILGMLTVITNSQLNKTIGKLEVENYNLFATNRHLNSEKSVYDGRLEMLEVENEIRATLNTLYSEDIDTLTHFSRDILIPYGVDLEEIYVDSEELFVNMFNISKNYMPYSATVIFSDRIDEIQENWEDIQNIAEDSFDEIYESDLLKY